MAIVTTSQNLTAVSYTAGEIIEIRNGATLTIDSTPATRPGTIQCITSGKLRIENSSTSTPIVLELEDMNRDLRFEGNGVLEIRGNKIEIGTSNGTQQTWDFSSLYSGAYTDITYAEVETASGSGVYMPWFIVNNTTAFIATAFYTNGATGSADSNRFDSSTEVLFWNSQTRILRSGDGTNGKLIPNGCKIRIPNILITNRDWQPDVSLIHAIRSLGTPTDGTFTITLINRRTGSTIGTTGNIAFNATSAQIDTAIEAVLGAGTVTNSGGPLPTAVAITLAGAYASLPIAFVVNSSVTGGTNSIIYSTENAMTNCSLLDLNPSGTLDAEWCMFSQKFYTANTSFSSIRCVNVGLGNVAVSFTSSNGSCELDTVSYIASPYGSSTASAVSVVSSAVKLNKVVIATQVASGNSLSTLPNLQRCDDVRILAWGDRTSTNAINVFQLTTLPNVPIIRPVAIGGRFLLTNLINNAIVEPAHSDTTLTQTATNPANAISMVNCIGLTIANTKKYGASSARNALFSADAACSNITAVGGSYDQTNNGAGVISQHNGALFQVKNLTVTNQRTSTLSFDAPTTFACTAMNGTKVFVGGGQATLPFLDSNQNGVYDLVGCELQSLVSANVSVQNFVGGNFMALGTTPTTGHVSFFAFGSGAGMSLSGSAFTDQIGSVFLPSNNDEVVITMPFSMHGITSFQNVTPRFLGECPGGFARAARIINDGGVTGGTFTITFYDETDTLVGTTAAIAYNATTTTVDTAIELITGAGSVTVSGSISAGYVITFNTGVIRRVVGNGANLTGGTKAGTMDSYARYTATEDNEVFPGIQFAVKNGGAATWGSYADLNGTNLAAAISALSGYSAGGAGLDMRIKVVGTGAAGFRRLQQCSLRTNIDPSLYTVTDSNITFAGPNPTDVIRIRKVSDPTTNLYSFTGGGTKDINVGANFGEEVFFVRENSTGTVLMRSLPATKILSYGNLGTINLFYGEEIQLAQASTLASLDAFVQSRLDATITSRLSSSYGATIDNVKKGTDLIPGLF